MLHSASAPAVGVGGGASASCGGGSSSSSAAAARASASGPSRVNIASLGNGGYRSLYLQAVERCGDVEATEDASDDACDVYFIVPCNREELHRRLLRLRPGARVNHFPGMVDLCEKVSFCRAVRQCMPLCPRLVDYIPPTWILPDELSAVFEQMDSAARTGNNHQAFIIKPEYGLQGHGIFLVRTRTDLEVALASRGLSAGEGSPRYVCQQYLPTPLLLDGYKFDLRLYVVLTSLAPLEAHLCHEGLARFCTTRYAAPAASNLSVRTGHLTNYALNSKQEAFARTQTGASEEKSSKRLLSTVLRQVAAGSGGRFSEDRFWAQLEEISALFLVALLPALAFTASQYYPVSTSEPSRCYHVLGLDVLLDSDYWPWLLEVNSGPAMDIETAVPAADAPPQGRHPAPPPARPSPCASSVGALKSSAAKARTRRCGSTGNLAQASSLRCSAAAAAAVHSHSESSRPSTRGAAEGATPRGGGAGGSPASLEASPSSSSSSSAAGGRSESKRRRRRRRTKQPVEVEEEEDRSRRHTDPWGGYRPSELRHRKPWPEICACTALAQPHRHAVCEVDERAKTLSMVGALRLATGADDGGPAYARVHLPPELARLARAGHGAAELCRRLSSKRGGLSGATLRRALQDCEEVVAARCGGSGAGAAKGRMLSQHEIDLLTLQKGTDPSLAQQRRLASGALKPDAARAELSVLSVFGMLQEVSRKCSERDPELAARQPLEKLEWLLEALQSGPGPPSPGGARSSAWPTLARRCGAAAAAAAGALRTV